MALVKDFPYNQRGLMRCCIATLANHKDDEVEIGARLKCDYEQDKEDQLVLTIDGWQWTGIQESE